MIDYLRWTARHSEIWQFERNDTFNTGTAEMRAMYTAIQAAMRDMPSFVHPTATIHRTAEIVGPVIIEAGAQILSNTIIQGPAYLGRATVVGNFSFLRQSCFLSRSSLVGNHCYCNEAVIGPSARIAHYANFSRSIVGYNSSISAFVLTATVRADKTPVSSSQGETYEKLGSSIGANTFVAPHVTLSPGVAIGSNSFIGSFSVVNSDIPDGVYVETERLTTTKPNTVFLPKRKKVSEFLPSDDAVRYERHYSGMLLVNSIGRLVLQFRDSNPGTRNPGRLSMFGGRAESGETASQCAARELLEETGIDIVADELSPLTETVIRREDGSRTRCSIFVLLNVDEARIRIAEGQGYIVMDIDEAVEHPDLTDLCRYALLSYIQG